MNCCKMLTAFIIALVWREQHPFTHFLLRNLQALKALLQCTRFELPSPDGEFSEVSLMDLLPWRRMEEIGEEPSFGNFRGARAFEI